MILLGALGLAMIYFFKPKRSWRPNNRMFFLGAAFMLLETKAVVQMALLFGSTWLVNSAVFFTTLVLILAANLYVIKVPSVRLGLHYVGLLVMLSASVHKIVKPLCRVERDGIGGATRCRGARLHGFSSPAEGVDGSECGSTPASPIARSAIRNPSRTSASSR